MQTATSQAALFTESDRPAAVQVVGIGGAGCRAASEIWRRHIRGVRVTCMDTDALTLDRSRCDQVMLMGAASMRGFGSGGNTESVAKAASETVRGISELVSDAACVIVIAGLAGTTGSAAAPIVARAAQASGALNVGIPIAPLEFEPLMTQLAAGDALHRLRKSCDGVLEVSRRSHENMGHTGIALNRIFSEDREFAAAFVTTISTIVNSGPDRCDANSGDLRSILRDGAPTTFGVGVGFGHTGAAEATQKCLDTAFGTAGSGHSGVERAVVLVESGPDISISQIATVTSLIESHVGSEIELDTAVRRSRMLGNNMRVSLIGCLGDKKRLSVVSPFPASLPVKLERSKTAHMAGSYSAALN